jgi:hypothetical protein
MWFHSRMSADLPGYDESLDDPLIDPDPDFRRVLHALNATGIHTVSSCQGHAPRTQYEDVRVWMHPYITVVVDPTQIARVKRLMKTIGARRLTISKGNTIAATFPRGWPWTESLLRLRSET